jgi:hypothetical protein
MTYFYLLGVQGLNGVGGDLFVCSVRFPLEMSEVFVSTSLFELGSD